MWALASLASLSRSGVRLGAICVTTKLRLEQNPAHLKRAAFAFQPPDRSGEPLLLDVQLADLRATVPHLLLQDAEPDPEREREHEEEATAS